MRRFKRSKKANDILHDELEKIYSDKGQIPDLTTLERKKTSPLTRFLVYTAIVLFSLAAVAWAGFALMWNPLNVGDGKNLSISIEGEENIVSGESARFIVRYENVGKTSIASLEIAVNLPTSFNVSESKPQATDEPHVYKFGSLSKGSDGSIELIGTFMSEVPEQATVQAVATYKPANFNSDFTEIATKQISIDDSVIDLTFEGATETKAGDEIEYVINVNNSGSEIVQNILINTVAPNGFNVVSSEPPKNENALSWDIAELKPDETKTIKFKGAFAADVKGAQEVRALTYLRDDDQIRLQSEALVKTEVLGGEVEARLISTDQKRERI